MNNVLLSIALVLGIIVLLEKSWKGIGSWLDRHAEHIAFTFIGLCGVSLLVIIFIISVEAVVPHTDGYEKLQERIEGLEDRYTRTIDVLMDRVYSLECKGGAEPERVLSPMTNWYYFDGSTISTTNGCVVMDGE